MTTTITTRTAGRVVGGMFLSGFLLYGGGSFLTNAATNGGTALPQNATSHGQLAAGSALMLANSAAVATIGALAFRVLRHRAPRTGSGYLLTRTVEATLLALAPLGTLLLVLLSHPGVATSDGSGSALTSLARGAVDNGESTYWVAMAALGVGSLFFCRTMLRTGLLPPLLAVGGIVGYAIFALGSVLQLAGYDVGLALSAPGGLFEVSVGSYLLAKGFRETVPSTAAGTSDDHTLIPRAGVVAPGAHA
ncbi:MAG: hypothetical protein QOF53_1226 [Nocardioidaceae bacterium]|jgi:hypothetical protein|nr:hypothetical protein [Nocardioidaceae bacterium]